MPTIIVETGEGVTNANSYSSQEYVTTFAENMGMHEWEDNFDMQEIAMINAAQFIDLRYSDMYCGVPLTDTQGLLFPRHTGLGSTGVPEALRKAFAYASILYVRNGGLALDANADGGRVVQSESVSVGNGAVQETTTYATLSANKMITKNVYATIDSYMKQIPCVRTGGRSLFIPTVRG